VLEAWEMDVGEDVVHGNERVLEVRERLWKGKKRRGSNVLAAEEI